MKIDLQLALSALNRGALLAYPTESVWGLGCDPMNETAFANLLKVKNRPANKGVILIADTLTAFTPFISELPKQVVQTMRATWQAQNDNAQAVTFIVPKHADAPSWLTGIHRSIAIRVTPHPLIRELCGEFGAPIISTSCNPSGKPPAKTLRQAQDYFTNHAFDGSELSGEMVFLAGNTLGFDKPSRIVDALTGAILR